MKACGGFLARVVEKKRFESGRCGSNFKVSFTENKKIIKLQRSKNNLKIDKENICHTMLQQYTKRKKTMIY